MVEPTTAMAATATTMDAGAALPSGETIEVVIDKTKGKLGLMLRETQRNVESDGTLSGDHVVS
jgi:hypothetical protein